MLCVAIAALLVSGAAIVLGQRTMSRIDARFPQIRQMPILGRFCRSFGKTGFVMGIVMASLSLFMILILIGQA